MVCGTQQEKEIATIKERELKIKLSDADCGRVMELCGKHGITVSQLVENFIGDLVDGTYSNGSDERDFAERWFERCWFGMEPEETLLKWLLDEWIEVEDFLDLQDNIKSGYEDLEYAEKNPEDYDEEEIEVTKIDIAAWEEELQDYKSRFLKENPEADWEEELKKVRNWYEEKESFINE